MKAEVEPGEYVVAVSGGVDSVVLLDLLAKQPGLELIVAHFDHGIRSDSREDAAFVAKLAKNYGLAFELGQARLGPNASEESARNARYHFLESIKQKTQADGIITAHHQDDRIETALINILRGTGSQGLVSLSAQVVKRPLLNVPKAQIINYAKTNNLKWHEDSTNQEERYLRNYLRKNVTAKITDKQQKELLTNIEKVAKSRKQINRIIATYSQLLIDNNQIDRQLFSILPLDVGNEFLTTWFRQIDYRDFDKKLVLAANSFIRTAQAGKKFEASRSLIIKNTATTATLVIR